MGQRPDEISERAFVVRVPRPEGGLTEQETSDREPHEEQSEYDETTAAAREDIELTRADMTSTIEAIQEKLDPEALSEQAKDTAHDVTDYAIREAKEAAREITDHAITQAREVVRDVTGQAKLALREATIGKVEHMARTATDTAGGWRQDMMDTIKANPMPAALVGLGLGWMLLNRPSGSSTHQQPYRSAAQAYRPGYYGYSGSAGSEESGLSGVARDAQQTVGRVTDRTQEKAGAMVDQVQGTASDVLDQVQETGGQMVDQVQEQAARAQSFLQRQLEENPLIVGAVAVAVGGVLAGTVRSTPREDQLLGQARDRVLQAAQEKTKDTMDKVGRVVDQAQTAAKDEAKKQELVTDTHSGA